MFQRISDAWRRYAPPSVQWVDTPEKADLVIIEVVGGEEYVKALQIPHNKRVIFQQCFLTSGVDPQLWFDLWEDSYAVLSFHNLDDYTPKYPAFAMNFKRTPLGAETNDFIYNPELKRPRKLFTTGHIASTESIDKLYEAIKATNERMFHTGENFKWDQPYYNFMPYMTTPELSRLLNTTQYVAGLRAIEGFEAMCIEGAMCGATPIVPKLPTYDFYEGFAKFVDFEQDVVGQLKDIFLADYVPLPVDRVKYIRYQFAWQTIMRDLYKFIL